VCREGACVPPTLADDDVGVPCTANCAYCTPALDTGNAASEVCTKECVDDDECPRGFDCRLRDVDGPRVCAAGAPRTGDPADAFRRCANPVLGASIVVVNERGQTFCSDLCFTDAPGGCPYGFHCGLGSCPCTRTLDTGGGRRCVEFTCSESTRVNDNVVCLLDPGHGVTCNVDADCASGDVCGEEGRCHVDNRAPCTVCGACASTADCTDPREVCLQRDDGTGFCTRSCEGTQECPGDAACRPIRVRGVAIDICVAPLDVDAQGEGCPAAYTCSRGCTLDGPCPAGSSCIDDRCEPLLDDEQPPPLGGCGGCGATDASSWLGLALASFSAAVRRRGQRRGRPARP
jgi:uncharacterized protein (TIGR03382 family)